MMAENLLIANHGPTISGNPRLCRLCGELWPCENAMEAIRKGVKAVKEGRTILADTFFEWMRAKYVRDIWDGRVADLERQAKALDSLEVVTRSYLQYPLKGEEPGYTALDVLAYCDEARAVIKKGEKR